jgi:ADP-ribosylglycohydrolase
VSLTPQQQAARPDLGSRYRGALLGLAAGDALGTTIEFSAPDSFLPLKDMVGGGPFNLKAGQWTDDTSMALCLAESLVECDGFDPHDQLRRYVRWWREGYLSSNGRCFDIGTTVRHSLQKYERTAEPYGGPTDPYSAGNGSLMRLAPVPLRFAYEPRLAVERAAESSRTTHGAPAAVDACRYFAGLIVGALAGTSKEELLAPLYAPVPQLWHEQPLHSEIAVVASGSFMRRHPPEIRGSGHVVRSLEAALWAFARSEDFETGALAAANLGDDADTTAAVFGQLAGAYYGEAGIPSRWRELLAMRARIEELADALLAARQRA